MPRLSLWKPQKSNDYKFLDRTISEMFTVGATDLYVHKYIGTNNPENSENPTQPHYDQLDPTNIQDLFFLENRDRKYDPNIYRLRGHYGVQNLDFDLSQFGLFLTNDIIFITVHYNDMIDVIGRKLMVGDVFELPHLTDYHPLNETIPIGLRRYYQITDSNYASEGFSQTWYPHLWRIKCEPLTNSQEFANILQQPLNKDNYLGDWDSTKSYEPGYTVTYGDKIYTPKISVPPGTLPSNTTYWEISTEQNLIDVVSTYNKNIEINEAILDEAKQNLPKAGYDVSQLYLVPKYEDGEPGPPVNVIVEKDGPIFPLTSLVMIGSNPALKILKKSNLSVKPGHRISLAFNMTAPTLNSTGSGPMIGDPVLTAVPLGLAVSSPYGTSDNTYIFADQYRTTKLTANQTSIKQTEISIVEPVSENLIGQLITTTLRAKNGNLITVFLNDTRIIAVNTQTNTITIDNETQSVIPGGNILVIASDFTGVMTEDDTYASDWDPRFIFIRRVTPRSFGYLAGYMTGDGSAPNGEPVIAGVNFPGNPKNGDYCLRLDYLPQKLFRFNGKMWVEISRNVRTETGLTSEDKSQLSTFINNNSTVPTSDGGSVPSRQSLSKALRIQAD